MSETDRQRELLGLAAGRLRELAAGVSRSVQERPDCEPYNLCGAKRGTASVALPLRDDRGVLTGLLATMTLARGERPLEVPWDTLPAGVVADSAVQPLAWARTRLPVGRRGEQECVVAVWEYWVVDLGLLCANPASVARTRSTMCDQQEALPNPITDVEGFLFAVRDVAWSARTELGTEPGAGWQAVVLRATGLATLACAAVLRAFHTETGQMHGDPNLANFLVRPAAGTRGHRVRVPMPAGPVDLELALTDLECSQPGDGLYLRDFLMLAVRVVQILTPSSGRLSTIRAAHDAICADVVACADGVLEPRPGWEEAHRRMLEDPAGQFFEQRKLIYHGLREKPAYSGACLAEVWTVIEAVLGRLLGHLGVAFEAFDEPAAFLAHPGDELRSEL